MAPNVIPLRRPPAKANQIVQIPLFTITADADLQPRAQMNKETYEEYAHRVAEGTVFPPVTLFADGDTLWLADGFHRYYAHRAMEAPTIAAVIEKGDRAAALRFALGANAHHGKRREAGDFHFAYDRAVRAGLVGADDPDGVRALLHCTLQWAYRLTEKARDQAAATRNQAIADRAEAGQSNRQIAHETGVVEGTVRNVLGAQKLNSLKITHPEPDGPAASPAPPQPHPAVEELNDLTSARGEAWGRVYDVLLMIARLPSIETLFADRYTRLDDVLGPMLNDAHDWLTVMQTRFFDAQANQSTRP